VPREREVKKGKKGAKERRSEGAKNEVGAFGAGFGIQEF
jgi:hypothetical protein